MTLYWYGRDDAETRACAERCLAILPDFYWARWKVGEMKEQAGDLDGAIGEYKKSWQAFEGDGKIAFSLGAALHRRGDQADALEILKQAALLHPVDPDIWQTLGDVLVAMGRPKDVMKIAMHMQRTWPKREAGHWLQADAFALGRRGSSATRIYERSIRRSPEDPEGHGRLAQLLLDDARFKQGAAGERAQRALQAAQRAADLSRREHANYLGLLAEAQFHTGGQVAARRTVAAALAVVHGSEPRVHARLTAAATRYR